MKKIKSKSGIEYLPLSKRNYDCLCEFLLSTIDDEPVKCRRALEKYELNYKSFYTFDKRLNHYCAITIELETLSDPLFIDDYATKEDLINGSPLEN